MRIQQEKIARNIIEKPYSRLMKCREAAAYLGICERKLWELEKAGRILSVRIDRSVRFDIDDLDAFIRQAKGVE